jgi:hypothetical protein
LLSARAGHFSLKAIAFRLRLSCAPTFTSTRTKPRIAPFFTTTLSQNYPSMLHAQNQICPIKHGICEQAVCNTAENCWTNSRCWDFVQQLFRSRLYELFAHTFVAHLPKVVSKFRLAADQIAACLYEHTTSINPLASNLPCATGYACAAEELVVSPEEIQTPVPKVPRQKSKRSKSPTIGIATTYG